MSIISYPALFHVEEESCWVEFPDLEGCFSNGKNVEEAFVNAKEALGLYLDTDDETEDRVINKPSSVSDVIKNNPNNIVMLIEFDSIEYARKYKNKAIKKTLSIPLWLNDLATKENINFSKLLQEALMKKLQIDQ